ncbi:MAG: methyltransferase domain-containing protein [Clostridia bacterium]|jgi:tRNA1Val (adenine37-N6)-methyltransferase|nr:methyltransferase domain-containing protein [Clostridia bacterium]
MNGRIELKENERLEELGIDSLKIIQNRDMYCFTSDAVILANSVSASSLDRALDIGSGSFIMPMIIAAKKNVGRILGVEIQPEMCDMARRSIEYNSLGDKIEVMNADINDVKDSIGIFDIVISNPPYFTSGGMKEKEEIRIARHEVTLTLRELISAVRSTLKFGGSFYMVQKVSRLAEVIAVMSDADIIPKEITLIYPKASKEADTFIVKGKRGAKHGLIMKRFVVYNEDGSMTKEAEKMYFKDGRNG